MAEEVKMPQMGESIAEGTIVRWLKQVGDTVKRDEPLFEISTDKVDAEIPSPAAGVLSEILAKEGETVAVNSVVAVINGAAAKPAQPPAAPAETAPAAAAPPAEEKPAPPAPAKPQPPQAPAPAETVQSSAETAQPSGPQSKEDLRRTRSSPLVRKIAEEHGVDISQIEGTGISGRVTKNDILSFVENRGEAAAAPQVPGAPAVQPAAAPPTTAAAPARHRLSR